MMYPDNINPAAHSIILSHILPELKIPKITFLEFGCSTGALGSAILSVDSRITWIGLDYNSDALSIAKNRLSQAAYSDFNHITSTELRSLEIHPDFIILVDVLEHVYEPSKFLSTVVSVFSQSRILCVLPNIACYQTYDRLTVHEFPYDDSGIFDKTHKTFYTAKSALELFGLFAYKPELGPAYLPDPVVSSLLSSQIAFPYSFKRGKYLIEISDHNELLSLCSYGFAYLFTRA